MSALNKKTLIGLCLASAMLAGCGGGGGGTADGGGAVGGATPAPGAGSPAAAAGGTMPGVDFRPNAEAGVEFKYSDPTAFVKMVASKSAPSRRDPFALLPVEANYEASQRAERFLSEAGGFTFNYEAPEEKDDTPVLEPQPYRRLAGVIIGENGVIALIDMGDGQTQTVRPGQKVGEWVVVSIDPDRAVLRRPGNKLPREISVPLAGPQVGGGGGGEQGGGAPGRGAGPGGGARGGGGKSNQDL